MRISDWSSDVCSSDLAHHDRSRSRRCRSGGARLQLGDASQQGDCRAAGCLLVRPLWLHDVGWCGRSEEHTSELQSLMRISYAVFCLKQKNTLQNTVKSQK